MKNILKIFAIVFLVLHVAAIALYARVLPEGLVQSLHLPDFDQTGGIAQKVKGTHS